MAAEFIIQSHRGAGNLAPENTMPSFEMAWRIGTVPEADVRVTSDGVIVAFHDNDLTRLAPDADPEIKPKSVNELPWSVVSKLDVGSYMGPEHKGLHIPMISDVLDAMRGRPERWLYLDVKKVPLEELAALARERGVDGQVVLASTIYEHLREWKSLLPDSNTLLWMGADEARLEERLADLRGTGFADLSQLQIHVNVRDLAAAEPFAPSSRFLREVESELRAKGILYQVLVKGSDDPLAYRRLMDLGVESFATDDPLVCIEAMGKRRRDQ